MWPTWAGGPACKSQRLSVLAALPHSSYKRARSNVYTGPCVNSYISFTSLGDNSVAIWVL